MLEKLLIMSVGGIAGLVWQYHLSHKEQSKELIGYVRKILGKMDDNGQKINPSDREWPVS